MGMENSEVPDEEGEGKGNVDCGKSRLEGDGGGAFWVLKRAINRAPGLGLGEAWRGGGGVG